MIDLNSLSEFGTPLSNTTKIPLPSGIKIGHFLIGFTLIGLAIYGIDKYYKNKYANRVEIIKP